MGVETWLAFTLACAVVLLIPGPTILLVIGQALRHGRRSARWTVPGVALGDFTAMTLSLLGVGTLLATSAVLFTAVKWLGAAYLVYLGLKMWRAPVAVPPAESSAVPGGALRGWPLAWQSFAVTALNPKSLAFFVAFLPQFLDPDRPVVPQFAVMEATFLTLAVLNALAYAMLAGSARRAVRNPAVARLVNRVGGGLMIGAGAMMAALRRA